MAAPITEHLRCTVTHALREGLPNELGKHPPLLKGPLRYIILPSIGNHNFKTSTAVLFQAK